MINFINWLVIYLFTKADHFMQYSLKNQKLEGKLSCLIPVTHHRSQVAIFFRFLPNQKKNSSKTLFKRYAPGNIIYVGAGNPKVGIFSSLKTDRRELE